MIPVRDRDDDGEVLAHLEERLGLSFRGERCKDAQAALTRLRRSRGIADAASLIDRLGADRELFDALVAEVTVGETYFLREPAQMEAIRRIVLPELVRTRRGSDVLRLWSAGCSTGEEAYSLAMIAEEEGLSDRTSILATDICARSLKKARAAEYGRWSLRNDRDGRLSSYFLGTGDRIKLIARLRERVRFARLNLASNCYPSAATGTERLDLILCRNVLIYFGKAYIRQIALRLYSCLGDGGWLVTGSSDPPLWGHAPFRTVIVPGAVLYRRGDASGRSQDTLAPACQERGRKPAVSRGGVKSRVVAPYGRVARRETAARTAEEWLARVKELSVEADLTEAEECAGKALEQFPLCVNLNYLRAMLLIALDRHGEATLLLRRVLFLDQSLAAAHLAFGLVLERQGDRTAAIRSFETAIRLCAALPPTEVVPLGQGGTAKELADGARAQIVRMKAAGHVF